MADRRVEMDFRYDKHTMTEVIAFVQRMSSEDPSREYFMDGDLYAIVSQPRGADA